MTPEQAEVILGSVRDWYKTRGETFDDGLGASNKTYFPVEDLLRRTGSSALPNLIKLGKMNRRNLDAELADGTINAWRERQPSVQSVIEYGTGIFYRKLRQGNCQEQRALAAFLIKRAYPATRIYAVDVPNVHGLLSVNAELDSPFGTLRSLHLNGAIVIDPWLSICCLPSAYPFKASLKMEKRAAKWGLIEEDSPILFLQKLLETKFFSINAEIPM